MTDKGSTSETSSSSNVKRLKELIIKRSSIKGQITKFKNYLSQTREEEHLSNIELSELNLKITKIEGLSIKFDNLQSEIEVLNFENIDSEIDERDNIEHEIIISIATAKSLLEAYTDNAKDQSQCFHDHQEMGFKLPQIQISKFDGAYFRWLEFRDTFESLIHNNNRISPIHKFHYLVSYLEGDAARIISNLEVSSANYLEAWKIICERYNNKRSLINHHLKSLFSIQPLVRESDRSLRFLVDHVTKNLRALASLDQPTDKWDVLLIYMLSSKLDNQTLIKWEEYRNAFEDIPNLNQFYKFLNDRADVLESLARNKIDSSSPKILPNNSKNVKINYNTNKINHQSTNHPSRVSYTKSFASTNQNVTKYLCVICNDNHKIYDCFVFKSKSIQDRLADVSKYKLCPNCLRQGHPLSDCRMGPCRECKQRHNSLLHGATNETKSNVGVSENEFSVNVCNYPNNQVLLSTALINVTNPVTNQKEKVRALLDCGSQSSFISKALKDKLSLNSKSIDTIRVIGIGNNCAGNVIETCTAQLNSINSSYNLKLSCFVLDKITNEIPKIPINIQNINLPHLPLADPVFYQPARIDVLIGADAFWEIVGNETQSLGQGGPKLIYSKFGWLISGPIQIPSKGTYNKIQCNHILVDSSQNYVIDEIITKFWEIEELPKRPIPSQNEKACEKHFLMNTSRLNTGRFCVRLPLVDSPDCLGDSYNLAKRRLLNLEQRFKRNPSMKTDYTKFITEYAELGHLSESNVIKPHNSYFLCHHPVLKENSESTKLRVVFDGSALSSSGFALNDILMVGPNMQDSLFSILIRSRQYKYILCGDIEKMYRQVLVHEDDRNLQLILWREDESELIKTLRLNTLTYGTASASYLSTRCLWQLGEEQDDELIETIIKRDFYIDDLITGSNDEEELRYIKNSIVNALKNGCFNLRKFKSNSSAIFEDKDLINSKDNLTISESSNTLGLGWDPSSDSLYFPLKDFHSSNIITKRNILSNSFKIFDPLGLLSPCIILPKMIMQRVWKEKLEWDEPVPHSIKVDWEIFSKNLLYLKDFRVPRLVLCNEPKVIELHSFSDASQSAYGACIYMRSIDSNNQVSVQLLCSKSKVSPIKPMTMPRLELCAALLATRLCKIVLESLRCKPTRILHWCDSSIVLGWINSDITKLKTFVANRINEIQETTLAKSWRYVPTATNPADLISRGVDAGRLISMKLWWSGPEFLYETERNWPKLNNNKMSEDLPEVKSNPVVFSEPVINFERYSKLNRLIRSFAYVRRFINNSKNPKSKLVSNLSLEELNKSFALLCIIAQRQTFNVEYNLLLNNKQLSSKSKLLSLSPFLDEDSIIRVGGRLGSSGYSYEKKHPILLHSMHHLTKLYFEREHLQNMHAGPQLLLAAVRETIWPVGGRHLARRTVNKCVVCRRASGNTLHPKMGELPPQRVTPDFPFLSVGIDFAGPFYIVNRKGRGNKLIKCYLCLFVCLRYKCIHLEAVSDLSKDAFLMTLRRFISRRGKPVEIFCDNGRNFVAAAKELADFLKRNEEDLSHFATQEKIIFKFSPAYAPHFGGIWEAGVKSAKFHLRRVIGDSHLTFEEILTLFAQIESILNSRPLYPLSSSPDDFLCLTPGHFLIGRPLTALPSPVLLDYKEINLQRYERLEKIRQHFWNRWQKEYISELQQRTKWKTNTAKLNIGDLVLLQEDYVSPLNWRLGRVARLFPGPDGISRVADINTTRGCVRRPLVRLCPLPVEEDFRG